MSRLKKYRPVTALAYDPLCETTTAFDVTNKWLTRLTQPTQKAVRLISSIIHTFVLLQYVAVFLKPISYNDIEFQ